mmetsp:Transcript_28058/g.71016  ORF Transcript_28058/g.71016 Transcript_28058/m.71016 type:complete len:236 (-) Transcript_28058:30-737(-)
MSTASRRALLTDATSSSWSSRGWLNHMLSLVRGTLFPAENVPIGDSLPSARRMRPSHSSGVSRSGISKTLGAQLRTLALGLATSVPLSVAPGGGAARSRRGAGNCMPSIFASPPSPICRWRRRRLASDRQMQNPTTTLPDTPRPPPPRTPWSLLALEGLPLDLALPGVPGPSPSVLPRCRMMPPGEGPPPGEYPDPFGEKDMGPGSLLSSAASEGEHVALPDRDPLAKLAEGLPR